MPPTDSGSTAAERVTEAAPQGKILKNEAGDTKLVAYSTPTPIGWFELTGDAISDHVAMLLDNGRLDDVVNEFLGYTG
jgi:hypothetical protein